MAFIIFILCIAALGFFHRREHEMFVRELQRLQPTLATETPELTTLMLNLRGCDWRVVKLDGLQLHLRRAFQIADREAAFRYGMPVAILSAMLVLLQDFKLAALYAAALGLKWFATVTVLNLTPAQPEYNVRLFGFRLFGETLKT